MIFPAGQETYRADVPPVEAHGRLFDDLDLTAVAATDAILHDRTAREEMAAFLSSIERTTGFVSDRVEEVVVSAEINAAIEEWRIGEAIAQAELEANRGCLFPWHASRDQKNPASSLPGAELVGFRERPGEPTEMEFAFGEVKTSGEGRWPPSVVRSLAQQLKDLRDNRQVVANLVRWLTMRATSSDWVDAFKSAYLAYSADCKHYSVFGLLVRSVEPKVHDLADLAANLAEDTSAPTTVELRALYLPRAALADMSSFVRGAK